MARSDDIPEDTADVSGARKALAQSRRSSRETDNLVREARATFAEARELRQSSDHFADKLRAIVRGAA